ncbi:phosphoenolpyruvate-protein phosphotransferase [Alkaliphilus metalliredigens QYMF]|uniref:Phosphoenolpyruvate-protein phosphotransferase n=1 Tax=Alkaliphilus metalliredigens (strain QYMF) TaxID=293826 RepID=A6TMP7_ALKMQ|nr:phosphoenolpyruvate--protein phosphotransferase [Alkaliphilus metalliredigens]ABR47465.1 phosphoenolpyruvate-protein phosphotransferase [Alkaliphilus metalliredigens QYMF]
MFKGTGASPGIAIGRALVYQEQELNIKKESVEGLEKELDKFQSSIKKSKVQLEYVKQEAMKKLGADKASIFEAHIMVLDDPELINQVKDKITNEKVSAEYAVNEVINSFITLFEGMDNEYMKERAADIRDVGNRILKNLLNVEIINLATLTDEVILVANDLTPSDTATMNKEKVLGFITNIGGRTSHTAIMAKSLEVPAIVGLKSITDEVKSGDLLIFDGGEGFGHINPDEQLLADFREKKQQYEFIRKELEKLKSEPSVSKDGRRVELGANIGTPKDVKGVLDNGGEGIGLYRTEFLYMNRDHMPSEEEQYEAYKEVLQKMEEKPVIIRTLDIGGDKELPYLNLPKELNPFLGYRAIRICLDQPEIFKVQLRALLRASVYGNLKIMYPMISSVEEVRAANEILQEVRGELDQKGIEYSKEIEVGIMVEIPATVVIGDMLIKEVDFFSIGTNDLIQYTTAVDRMNEKISHLYEPFHPAILRMIKMVIDHAHGGGKWAGMCGEMAGDPKIVPILLGLGLDEFSMSPISILQARKIIRGLSYSEMKKIAEKALNFPTAAEVKKFVAEEIDKIS